jgi:hypothetical protein
VPSICALLFSLIVIFIIITIRVTQAAADVAVATRRSEVLETQLKEAHVGTDTQLKFQKKLFEANMEKLRQEMNTLNVKISGLQGELSLKEMDIKAEHTQLVSLERAYQDLEQRYKHPRADCSPVSVSLSVFLTLSHFSPSCFLSLSLSLSLLCVSVFLTLSLSFLSLAFSHSHYLTLSLSFLSLAFSHSHYLSLSLSLLFLSLFLSLALELLLSRSLLYRC